LRQPVNVKFLGLTNSLNSGIVLGQALG